MIIPDEQLSAALDPVSTEWRSRSGLRDAAVLAPLFTRAGRDHLLYTKRRDDLPTHAGEVSFPGGARESGENALQCALRECREEIGLDPASVSVLGCLPQRVSIARYLVHFYVARVPTPQDLVIDRSEVEMLLEIPLEELADASRWEMRVVEAPPFRRTLPFFVAAGHDLWGLTAILTIDLLKRLGLR